jgi:aminoglycoside phosphotransferase family enzyme/predicted kinase
MQEIETHISRVLLDGEWAYKLKKPIKLPFLDFSTPALRRHACEEELRLNARTSPALYVDVRPLGVPWAQFVADPPAALAQGDAQTALDWVVRMRRFDADALLAARARAGLLTAADMDRLAAHIASFHQALPPVPPDWQPNQGLADWIAAGWAAIRLHPGRPDAVPATEVDALQAHMAERYAALEPWMAARRQAGWVRECHGDLHLGNLIDSQGQMMAFDAIEFDADLRCIDVMNDVAFTFMDLLAHDQPRLAWRLLDGWVAHTGDTDGLRGLALFAAYRALVRAQVALLGSGGQAGFERYWRCLKALLGQTRQPRLWIMMGLSGSGKSTAAGLLRDALAARGVGALRIRSDVERKRWLGVPAQARPGPDELAYWYSAATTRRTYARLHQMARDVLQAGIDVVVDAATLRLAERQRLAALAAQAGASDWRVLCTAPDAVLRQRLQARQQQGSDPSDADQAVMERQRAHLEPLSAAEHSLAWLVRNDGDEAALKAQIEALLSAQAAA